MPLFVRSSELGRFFNTLHLLEEMRAAFSAARIPGSGLQGKIDSVQVQVRAPGAVPGIPAFSVSVETPKASLIHLHDSASGELLATFEAARLFALRDAVVSALAVERLAREDASRVALIGASANAGLLLKTVRLVRSLRQLRVYDEDLPRAHDLAMRLFSELSLPAQSSVTAEEAVAQADIVIVEPGFAHALLHAGSVLQGTHVNLVAQGTEVLADSLLRQSKVFDADTFKPGMQGRESPDDVTVFAARPQPFEELVAAWHVYQVAREDDSLPRFG